MLALYCTGVDDKECVGLQRRFDDESKRRAVIRLVDKFFKRCKFALFLSDEDDSSARVIISTHGGIIKKGVDRAVHFVIVDTNHIDMIDMKTKSLILEQDIPTLSVSWLVECIKKRDILDEDDDLLKYKVDIEEVLIQPKKLKLEDSTSSEDFIDPQVNIQEQKNVIEIGDTWEGSCTYPTDGNLTYPFSLLITNNNPIIGRITWTSLSNASTKINGTYDEANSTFTFKEVAILSGGEFIDIPTTYTVQIDDNKFTGKLVEGYSDFSGDVVAAKKESKQELLGPLFIESRTENNITGYFQFRGQPKRPVNGIISGDELKLFDTQGSILIFEGVLEFSDPLNNVKIIGKNSSGEELSIVVIN